MIFIARLDGFSQGQNGKKNHEHLARRSHKYEYAKIFVPSQARNDFQPRITRMYTNGIPRWLGINGVAAREILQIDTNL